VGRLLDRWAAEAVANSDLDAAIRGIVDGASKIEPRAF
jgi:hypothetical protein